MGIIHMYFNNPRETTTYVLERKSINQILPPYVEGKSSQMTNQIVYGSTDDDVPVEYIWFVAT